MSNTSMKLHDFYKIHSKLGPTEMIVDVRNPDEYAAGHVPGSKNVPLPELPQRLGEFKKDQRLYVHCKRGGRAKTALGIFTQAGFDNIVCIDDAGMDLWMESGYPVQK